MNNEDDFVDYSQVEVVPLPHISLPGGKFLDTSLRPLVMGIVNITPDSFGTTPLYPDNFPQAAIDYALGLAEDGADIIDLGAESTRPGSEAVPADEQLARLLPVVKQCVKEGLIVSVDTKDAEVSKKVLDEGAHIINDVSALADKQIPKLCEKYGAAYVLMHTSATPDVMQDKDNALRKEIAVDIVDNFFANKIEALLDIGLSEEQIILDPGFGFGKTPDANFELMRNLSIFGLEGFNLLSGVSRKSFIGLAIGEDDPMGRDVGSIVLATYLAMLGATIHRVHDVKGTIQGFKMMAAMDAGLPVEWDSVIYDN